MSSVCIYSGSLIGLETFEITIEVDSTPGLHFFSIVGLADKSVQESKDRIASAIKNSGFIAPKQKNVRVIVNMAPADLKKQGPAFDLPIAVGYLLATKQFCWQSQKYMILGELSLDGSVRSVKGVISLVSMAKDAGYKRVYVPSGNVKEASIIKAISIKGVDNLKQIVSDLEGKAIIEDATELHVDNIKLKDQSSPDVDLCDIHGQVIAKRALAIAAAGGHNILFHGPPGSGKTMLAKALPGILPNMTYDEIIEVTKIYSSLGMANGRVVTKRPFRTPHHTASHVAIVGGGSWPRPGEVSLAHRGVLFLDEFPEFQRSVIEALREPLEESRVVVSRASGSCTFPCSLMFVAAMNPCPCGNYGSEIIPCVCTPNLIMSYQKKVSGPILDRVDLQIPVSVETQNMRFGKSPEGKTSQSVKEEVQRARNVQRERYKGISATTNSELTGKMMKKYFVISKKVDQILNRIMTSTHLSIRGYHKTIKVARTIADLEGADEIEVSHVAEAASYRISFES